MAADQEGKNHGKKEGVLDGFRQEKGRGLCGLGGRSGKKGGGGGGSGLSIVCVGPEGKKRELVSVVGLRRKR